uniref:60S ribosomal protein L13 n=1 Tax=Pseudictyota dubia TaxID=2749911 RepID=A0A7R9WAC9_9STRA|mmetsp:Transcript_39423/g.72731  ORF Transcript_39423/g.72731 Transcript_39423/m.72731 type:complete len:208 (+) Transcript_39423:29-652(+)|eukprot:TRINITY_DN59837_c0_g1_i1.p2 TRINITY_DN59837_c0_g1~~TRINITY_DN59837_c0_g1_i1.p2  ORF type:complete len:208 (-),score=59.72 TRINITY_DN59837_c0_g1_i1:200-823(-)
MVKHNNVVPNQHFHKQWQNRVKTWFDQPAKKKARRAARKAKAAAIAPRPAAGLLRPAVRCPTQRYNTKVRAGRGFTLEELKTAGISKRVARTIGIAVDHRRSNKSTATLQENVQRLNAYKAKLVVFPRGSNAKPKTGDASVEETSAATQLTGPLFPITAKPVSTEFVALTDDLKAKNAYRTLRIERCNRRMNGLRIKRAKEAAEAEK